MSISVVVISREEGQNLRDTVENLQDTLPAGGEVIVVDDGSSDGSADFLKKSRTVRLIRGSQLGVAKARNLGAGTSRGKVIVFADAHIELQPDWWRPLVDAVEPPQIGAAAPGIVNTAKKKKSRPAYGITFRGPSLDIKWFHRRPAKPRPVPILPGCCTAMRRDVFEAIGGWDEGMRQRGNVDNEGCIRLWLLGYELVVTGDTVVGHLFRRESPYVVAWPNFVHNRVRLPFVHFNQVRLGQVISAVRHLPMFGQAMLLIAGSDVMERRRQIAAQRVRDDAWLFERFGWKW